jgi:hypothetical protein
MAIVKANYLAGGKRAGKTVKAVRRAAKYYTFRDGPHRAGRIWHADDGRRACYADVHAEMADGAQAYPYTYRIVLSTSAADIGAAGYHQVLAGHFAHYYFVEHHNTDYPHAHVIGFCQQRINKRELQAMRSTVLKAERERAQGQERSQEQEHRGQLQEPVRLPAGDQPSSTRERDHGLG